MAKPLLKSNPFLQNTAKRRKALRISAATSSAVEGIRKPFAQPAPLIPQTLRRGRAKSGV